MAAPHPDVIAWIDTETTGLDPHTDALLEVALVLTDNDLHEIAPPISLLITPPAPPAQLASLLDPYVLQMHTRNRLFEDLASQPTTSLEDADRGLTAAILDCAPGGDRPLLGGNSITHGRGFLRVHLPRTFAALHYRSIDVTSIEMDMERSGFAQQISAWRSSYRRTDDHRALGDIRDCLAQLRALRSMRPVPRESAAAH